jgi:hypothetical protein
MPTSKPEYLRMKAAQIRRLASENADDPVVPKLLRLAADLEALASDTERRSAS